MITLATICLNEEEFISAWLSYHYDSFERILICEGAARGYPQSAVSAEGLSSDGTAQIVRTFPDRQNKIRFTQHGWAGPEFSTDDRVPAKMELRNVYAREAETGYLFTLDMDEFLHPFYVRQLVDTFDNAPGVSACAIPQVHLWQDTQRYITGGYADVPHYRMYRWAAGSRYVSSHNWPSGPDGQLLTKNGIRPTLQMNDGKVSGPAIIHYGFCERKRSMEEKNAYYVARGEETTRPSITSFRAAALAGRVPAGCTVQPYRGYLPYSV